MRSLSEKQDRARPGKRCPVLFSGLLLFGMGLVLGGGFVTPASANPAGGAVRAGTIRIQDHGDLLRVIQESRMGIIDWNSFSIASGETTRFVQPDAGSATLNRVVGESLSRIDGRLLANGRIFLLNSNGIVIGRDGVVDVAGFTASTLDLSNEAFLAGGDLTFRGDSQAAVVNLGSISAFDGDIFLVAATVENAGSLRAPRGTVGLAAGNEVLIRESGSERIFVRGASGGKKEEGVVNKGAIEANVAELKAYGGNVYGMAVKNEGRVVATGVSREGGQIFLRAGGRRPGGAATGGGRVRSTGHLEASRPGEAEGGRVVVDAGPEGSTEIGGVVEAGSDSGEGGEIILLGNSVELFEGSLILADGESGGGTIRVGGGPGGKDPDLANAETVTVGRGSLLRADALGTGEGGSVIVFAEGSLAFHGALSVRGGAHGGNGGFAELSGRRELFVDSLVGQVDLSAASGKAGTLLLDPIDIEILAGSGNGEVDGTMMYANDIAAFLDAIGSLEITTSPTGQGTGQQTGNGDITMASGAVILWTSDNDLTLLADRDFVMREGATIEAEGNGAFSATAARSIALQTGASIRTTGGDLLLSANWQETVTSGDFIGVSIDGATVAVDGVGSLTIRGRGGDGSSGSQHGIWIEGWENSALVQGGAVGTTVLDGIAGASAGGGGFGFLAEGAMSHLTTLGSDLEIVGEAGAQSGGGGLSLRGGVSVTTAPSGGAIRLKGTAAAGNNAGIVIETASLESGEDAIWLEGQGSGEGQAIHSVTADGWIESGGGILLKSAGGDVVVAGAVRAVELLLQDDTPTGDVGFSLDHSFNDVAVLAAGGTGSSGRVGSVAFRNGNGFAVGSVEGGDEVGFEGIRANGDVSLFAAGGNLTPLVVNEAIDSLAGSIHLEGFDVAIQSPVSALSGDITVAVGAQTYSQGVGGTAMIAADLVHGGELRFLGSTGAGDTVTYADWSGAPLAFDFAWLDGIENLIGSSSASDQFHGPGAAASYRFGAGGTIEVGGVEVSGFENLFAGSGNDTFVVAPGGGLSGLLHGGGGVDLLDYAGYGSPVSVHLGAARATGFNGVTGVEIYRGSAFEDTLTGTAGNDTFTIYADNAGQVNGGTLFFSFEHLRGIGGADRFLFQNQATVGSVDGGAGDDLLQIDDRNLGGTHTYTITGNRITRNPSYLFTGLERIRLLLGPGDDTVVTGDYGLVQTFDGGAGNDFLRLGSGIYLRDSPMAFGGSTIHHSGFEGPFPPDTAPGEVLQVQTNQVPRPPQGNGFLVEDRFTPGGAAAGEALLQALSQQSGNAFSAVLAGQAVLLQLDGQQYLFRAPSSLDGSLTAPPPELIERLREQLRADGWAELAEAIEFAGPMSLISSDGPFPVDLASPVPPELLAVLGNALAIDAAGELFSALEMLVFVPVTAADGVVAIFVAAVPVDDATRALLLEHLGEEAFTEMEEALAP